MPNEIIEIPLDQVLLNDPNPRGFIDPVTVEAISASMAIEGQKTEIKVRLLENHQYRVVGGDHRVLAARKLGWTTIQAVVLDITPDQAYLEGYLDNQSKPMGWFADYMAIEVLWKQTDGKKGSQKLVADRLMKTETMVSRALKLLPLLNASSRELILASCKNPDGYELLESPVRPLTGLAKGQPDDQAVVEAALRVVYLRQMTAGQVEKLVTWVNAGNLPDTFHLTPSAPKTSKVPHAHVAPSPTASKSQTSMSQHPPAEPTPAQTSADPKAMGSAETMAWDMALGISVLAKIKAKVKKGERPTFGEALLLAVDQLVHLLIHLARWLSKHGIRGIFRVIKWFSHAFIKLLKVTGLLGPAILVLMVFALWFGYQAYNYGVMEPVKIIGSHVPLVSRFIRPSQKTAASNPIPTPVAASPQPAVTLAPTPVITPAPTVEAAVVSTPTVTTAHKHLAQKKATPVVATNVQATPNANGNHQGPSPSGDKLAQTNLGSQHVASTQVPKTDIAGDILKQAAPGGVDVAKKLFGL